MRYSELDALERLGGLGDDLVVEQFGRDCFIRRAPEPADIAAARAGYDKAAAILQSGDYDVVILDEASIATHFKLFSVDELLALLDIRPDHVELIITGRRADPRLLERADLVTEMREVKHYYQQGVEARKGFES
jgi:cob(I)alamin adenosyltransferase